MDKLKYYKSLVAGGQTDEQAQAHVDALDGAMYDIVTKDYLDNELVKLAAALDSKIFGIDAKMNTIKALGWAMFVAIVLPATKYLFGI